MVPIFPDFKIITLDDRALIKQFTLPYPPYNDFDFVSLWTYNSRGENAFSFYQGNLLVKMEDFITGKYFYSFLGTGKLKQTVEVLLSRASQEGIDPTLRLIPGINLEGSPDLQPEFSVHDDLNSCDYILSVEHLSTLQGFEFKNKRNQLNKFKNSFPSHVVKEIDLTNVDVELQIENLYSKWFEQKENYSYDTTLEHNAIRRLFPVANELHVQAIGIYVDDKLIAFSTYHIIHDGYAIFSFHKADITFEGIYTLLNNELAKRLFAQGVKFINYEQDLGIENLKNAKMLWRPIFFLKKYSISAKN